MVLPGWSVIPEVGWLVDQAKPMAYFEVNE
jgi:hypothetical protein